MSIDRRVAERRSRREYPSRNRGPTFATRSARCGARRDSRSASFFCSRWASEANAAMFTFLDAVFLRMPNGVVDPAGMRRLWTLRRFSDGEQYWPGFSYSQFEAVRALAGDRATVVGVHDAEQDQDRARRKRRGGSARDGQHGFLQSRRRREPRSADCTTRTRTVSTARRGSPS